MNEKINVLMCGSDFSNGGGVVSVTKKYFEYTKWDNISIEYVATHVNGNVVKKICFFIKAYFKILGKLIKGNITLLHLHLCDGGPFYRKAMILFTAKVFNKAVILHHHTDYTEFFGSLFGFRKIIIKKALKTADINIVLGKNLINVIKDYETKANVIVLYNAVKTPDINSYNGDGNIILFLGWLLERKGVLDFINAIKDLDNNLDRRFKIALCGLGKEDIKNKIHNFGVDHRIIYMGWADTEKKKELLKNTVICVLPSYREGLPMTILETMSYGIPNIASNISTIPEVIDDGVSGYLIEPHNVKEISKKIETLLKSKSLRLQMSENAYHTIQNNFSISIHMEKVKQIYTSFNKTN